MKDTEKTQIILDALMHKHTSWSKAVTDVTLPELRLGSGYSDIAQRRIDLFIISSEKGNYTTAYEIKVSRGDFLRDIKDDLKQRGARLYASNFFYVAPKGMIKAEEIPVWAGLMEYDFEQKRFQKTVPAPLQSRNTPSWSLICSLVRNINRELYREQNEETSALCKYYETQFERAKKLIKQINLKEIQNPSLQVAISSYKFQNGITD